MPRYGKKIFFIIIIEFEEQVENLINGSLDSSEDRYSLSPRSPDPEIRPSQQQNQQHEDD